MRGESLSFLVPGGGEVWRQWRLHLGYRLGYSLRLSGRGAVAKWWRPLVIAFGDEPGVRGVGESLASLSPGGARGEGSRREPLLSRRAEE